MSENEKSTEMPMEIAMAVSKVDVGNGSCLFCTNTAPLPLFGMFNAKKELAKFIPEWTPAICEDCKAKLIKHLGSVEALQKAMSETNKGITELIDGFYDKFSKVTV